MDHQRNPRPLRACLLATIFGSILGGCGPDGPGSTTVSGTVVGSYFQNAKVCWDANNNAACDATEDSVRTDSAGKFTLPGGTGILVADIGTDAIRVDPDTGTATPVRDRIVFRAPAGNTSVLSSLSTMVAVETDAGVTLAQALATVGARLGVDPSKLLTDYNKETDALVKSQLLAHGNGAINTIQAVIKNAGGDLRVAISNAMASRSMDPKVLYVWTQIGANDTTPFTKIKVAASSYTDIALNANPVGKVPDTATYTIADASNGNPLSTGALYARAITTGTACPQIPVDGFSQAMLVRAPAATQVDTSAQFATGSRTIPVKADFNVLTCEFKIPDTARTAIVNGQALKLVNSASNINRVVVIGDTGCRIKGPAAFGSPTGAGDPVQDCTDDRAWPYKRIAAAAASFNPDLILHNGDIHYREGIPAGVESPQGVAGSARNEDFLQQKGLTATITYGWAAWQEDFFKPSGPLLAAAPWGITRGNHESCFRAGTGWFHFLDPRPFPANEPKWSTPYDPNTCNDYIDPVAMTLGDLQIALLDNSGLQSTPGANSNTQGWTHGDHIRTARQLNALSALAASKDSSKVTWIVTHKPLFAFRGGAGAAVGETWQYQKAIGSSGVSGVETYAGANGMLPGNTQMLHAGHIHGWQMLSFPASTNLPTSFLNGVSGDTLESGFVIDTTTGNPLAPANFGNNITSGVWPWLGAKAALWISSLVQYLPDAFSTSPIVNIGKPVNGSGSLDQARIAEFGFVVYDRILGTTNWKGTFYDMDRKKIRTCTTTGKRTSCDG
ncbi:MAG: hypothetical protein D4S02_10865 [Rhodocyclaceae bacterium]|nr:MAG: hypothetical protein D4S02_10865 [Rhodocyclaceae bacterium]